ncbi:MAG: MarR family winged helix-turn-helix transcriptional regulator [Acidimicrobiales bacterium]
MPSNASELTDLEYEALARLRHALRVFLRFSEEAARREGLTPKQHQLLLAIRGFPGGREPTIGDVAELLQLRHHSVVELVGRAIDAGLVRGRVDTDDHRRHRLTLTSRGKRKLASLSPAHQTELRRFRDEMTVFLHELG